MDAAEDDGDAPLAELPGDLVAPPGVGREERDPDEVGREARVSAATMVRPMPG
jgi:hypothetical protein